MTNSKLFTEEIDNLFKAIALCKTKEEISNFIRDIMAYSELTQMAARLETARLISEGLPQREVAKKVGVSITTVTRVAQGLKYSSTDGCATILKRMSKAVKKD